jgi:hypothetical protein
LTDVTAGVVLRSASSCCGGLTPLGSCTDGSGTGTVAGGVTLLRAIDAKIGIPTASAASITTAGKIWRSRRSA